LEKSASYHFPVEQVAIAVPNRLMFYSSRVFENNMSMVIIIFMDGYVLKIYLLIQH
jgi:hypothetical protein